MIYRLTARRQHLTCLDRRDSQVEYKSPNSQINTWTISY